MSGYERILSLSIAPHYFVGKKPVAILYGEERVAVKSWREVYTKILCVCNRECHDELMYLRDKAAGKVRVFLSASPKGMTRPFRIDENMYGEIQYGSETLMHILRDCLLKPARFDYSNIRIVIKAG